MSGMTPEAAKKLQARAVKEELLGKLRAHYDARKLDFPLWCGAAPVRAERILTCSREKVNRRDSGHGCHLTSRVGSGLCASTVRPLGLQEWVRHRRTVWAAYISVLIHQSRAKVRCRSTHFGST